MTEFLLLVLAALVGYCWGVFFVGRRIYRKAYERGQDETIARFLV